MTKDLMPNYRYMKESDIGFSREIETGSIQYLGQKKTS